MALLSFSVAFGSSVMFVLAVIATMLEASMVSRALRRPKYQAWRRERALGRARTRFLGGREVPLLPAETTES